MKSQFDGNSYSIGWIECRYAMLHSLTETEVLRYLELLRLTNQKGDNYILDYIQKYQSHLVTTLDNIN